MFRRFLVVFAFFAFIIVGCAGIDVIHTTPKYQVDKSAKYIVFPFRDPYLIRESKTIQTITDKAEFPGVGRHFTHKFVALCSSYGLDVTPIFNDKFKSSEDINIVDALSYAKEQRANFIITGQVTKWIYRATFHSHKRNYAGLEIFVRNVDSGKIVFTAELEEHNNVFWTVIPDEFVDSLTQAMVVKFIGTEVK